MPCVIHAGFNASERVPQVSEESALYYAFPVFWSGIGPLGSGEPLPQQRGVRKASSTASCARLHVATGCGLDMPDRSYWILLRIFLQLMSSDSPYNESGRLIRRAACMKMDFEWTCNRIWQAVTKSFSNALLLLLIQCCLFKLEMNIITHIFRGKIIS